MKDLLDYFDTGFLPVWFNATLFALSFVITVIGFIFGA